MFGFSMIASGWLYPCVLLFLITNFFLINSLLMLWLMVFGSSICFVFLGPIIFLKNNPVVPFSHNDEARYVPYGKFDCKKKKVCVYCYEMNGNCCIMIVAVDKWEADIFLLTGEENNVLCGICDHFVGV